MAVKLGNGNWAVKENKLLAYNDNSGRFFNKEFDFSRGSSATYVGKDGLIKSAASDVPRIDFSDSTNGALLLEGQSTNLFPYSSDLTSWTKIVSSVSYLENVINPSGETFASKITQTSSGGYVQLSRTFTGVETFSAFVKKSSSDFVRFYAGGNSVYFNILNGTIETISGSVEDKSITDFGNGWFRISITVNSTSSSSVRIYPASSGSSTSGLNSLFVYGTQLEALSYATSYIPSLSGSATTRLADVCNNSGSAQDFNSESGVLYFEGSALADDVVDKRIFLSDGTMNNYVAIGYSRFAGNIIAEIVTEGVLQTVDWGATGVNKTNNNKFALSWGSGTMKFYVNGTQTNTESVSSPSGLNVLEFNTAVDTLNMYAKVKDLQVFTEAKSDEFLAALTTI